MSKTVLIAILALTPAQPAFADPTPPAAQIEAAERAFAADGAALGMRGAFLGHMADDAIVFAPFPASAKVLYANQPDGDQPRLEWWPAWVVAARSGDLGLSTGPSRINGKPGGWYATIWRKDAGGAWRWIYDGGAAADAISVLEPEAPAELGPRADDGEASPAQAFEAVRSAEAALAKAARGDAAAAYRAALSDDARLLGPRGTRALAPTELAERLALRTGAMTLTLRGGGASRGGDFVWTHGEAHWTQTGPKSATGHYMHVWQKRAEGWRLIFEALINDR